jgi:hypothetical protein
MFVAALSILVEIRLLNSIGYIVMIAIFVPCGISRGSPSWIHLAFPNEHRQWCSATVVVDSNSFDVVLQFRPGVPVVRGLLVIDGDEYIVYIIHICGACG